MQYSLLLLIARDVPTVCSACVRVAINLFGLVKSLYMLCHITSYWTSNQGAPSQAIGLNKLINQPTNESTILQAMDSQFVALATYSLRGSAWRV